MGTFLAVLASAVLLVLGNGRLEVWALAWIALAPVLRVAYRGSARRAFAAAVAVWIVGSLDLVAMYVGRLPVVILGIFVVVGALGFAVVVLVSRWLVRRLAPLPALLAFPAALAAYELGVAHLSPHGTAASLAYSQVACLPVLQAASVVGYAGISFLIALPCSALALMRRDDRRTLRAALLVAAVFAAVLVLGALRLHGSPMAPPVVVGMVASDKTGASFETADEAVVTAILERFDAGIHAAAARGARWVVLSEKLVALRPAWEPRARATLAAAARRDGVWLVAGLNELPPGAPPRNLAVVWAPDGRQVAEYSKRHLLPGPETGYEAGRESMVIVDGVAVAICKDLDFVDVGSDSARAGGRLLLAPAWDFDTDARFHGRIAVERGVESGLAVARSAARGLLTASDAYGRIVAEARSDSNEPAVLVARITPGPGATFYARYRALVDLAFAALLAALVALAGIAPSASRWT